MQSQSRSVTGCQSYMAYMAPEVSQSRLFRSWKRHDISTYFLLMPFCFTDASKRCPAWPCCWYLVFNLSFTSWSRFHCTHDALPMHRLSPPPFLRRSCGVILFIMIMGSPPYSVPDEVGSSIHTFFVVCCCHHTHTHTHTHKTRQIPAMKMLFVVDNKRDWWFLQLKKHQYERFWEARMRDFVQIMPIAPAAIGENPNPNPMLSVSPLSRVNALFCTLSNRHWVCCGARSFAEHHLWSWSGSTSEPRQYFEASVRYVSCIIDYL